MTVPFLPSDGFPAAPVLDGREVHLWVASLDQTPERVSALFRLLSPDERERADRRRSADLRRRYIVARGLLRELVGAHAGMAPERLQIVASGAQGKPVLGGDAGATPLHFNLSHAGEHVLIGVARQELGVDLEVIEANRHVLDLADRFFATAESAVVRSLPEPARTEAFYNAWTRKEAYVKALGTGLAEPLGGFEVTVRPGEPARLLRVSNGDGNPADWSLYDLRPRPGLVGALALRGRDWRVQAWLISGPRTARDPSPMRREAS
jgi:4'-phosphopantetheinyl transferase